MGTAVSCARQTKSGPKSPNPDHAYPDELELMTWDSSPTCCQCFVLFATITTFPSLDEHQVGLGRNWGRVVLPFWGDLVGLGVYLDVFRVESFWIPLRSTKVDSLFHLPWSQIYIIKYHLDFYIHTMVPNPKNPVDGWNPKQPPGMVLKPHK